MLSLRGSASAGVGRGGWEAAWGRQSSIPLGRGGAGKESEETHFPSPGTSGTLGVSSLPRWVSASGRRVASFLLSRAIFRTLVIEDRLDPGDSL